MHICIYVKYCIAIIHAAEPQATIPTRNRSAPLQIPERSLEVPGGFQGSPWKVSKGPRRVPGGSLDHQILCFPRNLKDPKGP